MSTNIVSALGAGSGIDIKGLADSLVAGERTPKKELIDKKIAKTEAKISGYGAMKFALSDLKAAFNKINDASDFNAIKPNNTQPSAFGVTTTNTAEAGNFSLDITQIALAQRTSSQSFAARDTSLHGGSAFNLNLTVGGVSKGTIAVTTDTPAGMVSAINGAKLGVTAQLVNTGKGYNVVLTGETGASQSFSMTADAPAVVFDQSLQTATDAEFKLNGIAMTRGTNSINDVVDGVTLNLYTATTGAAQLDLNRDTANVKANLQGLVTAYNDFETSLKILGDSTSEVKDFGGVLAGESLLQSVRNQVRALVTNTSTTPGTTIKAARDVGLSLDRFGKLTLNEAKLDSALQNNFSEVATMFTAGTSDKSIYSTAPAGLAGSAINSLEKMLLSTGAIETQTKGAAGQIVKYKDELKVLESRMERLLNRYMSQFSAMESIVGSSNSTRSSLKSTFDSMASAYSR